MPVAFENISLEIFYFSLSFLKVCLLWVYLSLLFLSFFSNLVYFSQTDSTCFFQSQALNPWMLSPAAFHLFGILLGFQLQVQSQDSWDSPYFACSSTRQLIFYDTSHKSPQNTLLCPLSIIVDFSIFIMISNYTEERQLALCICNLTLGMLRQENEFEVGWCYIT